MFKFFQKRQIFNRKSDRLRINKIIFTTNRTYIFICLNRKKITSQFTQMFKISKTQRSNKFFRTKRRNNFFINNVLFFDYDAKESKKNNIMDIIISSIKCTTNKKKYDRFNKITPMQKRPC